MIVINIHEEEKSFLVEMNGHAEYRNDDIDIVCASASILMYTLVNRLEELYIDGTIYCMKPGHFKMEFDNTKESKQVLAVIECGWRSLVEQFPAYIGINRGEIKK